MCPRVVEPSRRTLGEVQGRPRDAVAVVAIVMLAVTSLVAGLRTGWSELDVDEAVFVETLHEMRSGRSYYDAMADALATKEGARPDAVRAVRPPTTFLLLRPFPSSWWRWVATIVIAAGLVLLWRLGRPVGPWGGVVAVVAGGLWLVGAAPLLFLHAELWGLPWLLGALVALRRRRLWAAAALLVAAVAFRELYVVFLVAALVAVRPRLPWVAASAAVGALAVTHAVLAARVLDDTGRQVSLGNEAHSFGLLLRILSPGDSTVGGVVGAALLAAAAWGLLQRWPTDPTARVVAPAVLVLAIGAFVATRTYWALTFAPVAAAYVAAAPVPSARPNGAGHRYDRVDAAVQGRLRVRPGGRSAKSG